MTVLLRSVLVGSYRAGITTSTPTKPTLRRLAMDLFDGADINSNDQVSLEEFCAWASMHLETKQLLLDHGFTTVARQVSAGRASQACSAHFS